MKKNKALFLDRDGTINEEMGYAVHKIEEFKWMDGIFELCESAINLGYKIIIVTNQAAIENGRFTISDYENITQYMLNGFQEKNIVITDVFFCPSNDKNHPDRKPNPGMFLKASEKYDIDFKRSIMVGNSEHDILAAHNAKVPKTFLLSKEIIKTTAFKKISQLIEVKKYL